MLNIIKYLPWEWRIRNEYCIPKGPSFKRAERLDIPIGGSRLRLSAPFHSPSRRRISEHLVWGESDALRRGNPLRFSSGVMANDHWGYNSILKRDWAFWGPWMSGVKAEIVISISVISRHDGFALPCVSFFNPRAFEMVLLRYFNDFYGHHRWEDGKPRWQGPFDWKTRNQLPVCSATCKIYKLDMDGKTKFSPRHLFLFPVTDQHFVRVEFRQGVYSRDERGNPAFDMSPVQALQDAVQNSIRLELSPDAQAAWDKAQAEARGQTLTESFPLLKWPCYPSLEPGSDSDPELAFTNTPPLPSQ